METWNFVTEVLHFTTRVFESIYNAYIYDYKYPFPSYYLMVYEPLLMI